MDNLLIKTEREQHPSALCCKSTTTTTTTCQPSSVTSFPHTHLCRSHIFDPNRSPIAILSCWFDSFNLRISHGMTFNHWEPNLSWNALNLFTSVSSSRKIMSAISLSKIGSVQFFWISLSGAILESDSAFWIVVAFN